MAAAVLPALALLSAGTTMAANVVDESKTLSSAVDPIERDFDVASSGTGKYKVTLNDLGAQLPTAAPLSKVQLVITRDAGVVAVLDGTATDKPVSPIDTMEFDATPGRYSVHVVGIPGPVEGSGPVGVKIESVATPSTTVLDFSGTLASPAAIPSNGTTYQLELDIPAGSYDLTLTDFAFPQAGALEKASVYLFQAGVPGLAACLNLTPVTGCNGLTQTVTLAAGKYQLVAGAELADGKDGALFSVQIKSSADGTVLHSRTVAFGAVKQISDTSFQLDTGPYTLSRKDLEFPSRLIEASAIVTRAGQWVALANAVTPDAVFTVAADDTRHDVFAYSKADSVAPASGAGTVDVELKPASGPAALSYINAMGDPAGNPTAYTFPVDVAAGAYRVKFGDFQFPAALASARVAVVQNGSVVSKTEPNAPSTLDATLVAGHATVVVVVKPAAITGTLEQAGGTFGLEMALTPSATQNVLDVTQGVGGVVSVRKVSIPADGRYDLKVTDLDAPDVFSDLMVVISRGSQKVGEAIVGSGQSNPQGTSATLPDLPLTVGNYAITLIARPGAELKAATYGLLLFNSPPAPTVMLKAAPTTIEAGKAVGLEWSSQGATSCTASSNPSGFWSGTKSLSGSDSSTPITGATTFTLTCTDANNRKTEQSAKVEIAAQNNTGGGGGGGAFDWLTLAALTLAATLHLGRRRRGLQMTDL